MSSISLKKRVATLEQELTRLKNRIETEGPGKPWWERIVGTFGKDPIYKQAMNLGKKYRQSLDPRKSSRKRK
jgi:hypothetical protein